MAVMLTELMTAYLLFGTHRLSGRPEAAVLGCGYMFVGLIVVAQMLVFPQVFSPTGLLGAGQQSAVWLWTLWHGGFPLFILAYAATVTLVPVNRMVRRVSATGPWIWPTLVLGLVLALTALVTVGHDLLPPIIAAGKYSGLLTSGWGPGVLVLNILALVAFVRATRLRTLAEIWIAVAVLAALLDVVLTLAAGARYSNGWYLARINSVVSSSVVLVFCLRGIVDIQGHLMERNRLLEQQANHDPLTGLANRRLFEKRLDEEWRRAQRTGAPLTLCVLDIDHFKKLNDTLGHMAGDEALLRVALLMRDHARRPGDLAARCGGEEFALLLPETPADEARRMVERLREQIAEEEIPNPGAATRHLTISAGIACSAGVHSPQELISAADSALYAAKGAGRNRVSMLGEVVRSATARSGQSL